MPHCAACLLSALCIVDTYICQVARTVCRIFDAISYNKVSHAHPHACMYACNTRYSDDCCSRPEPHTSHHAHTFTTCRALPSFA